jgi:large subunit ribosomal protein L24e
MAASREKVLAHRKKLLHAKADATKLVEPVSLESPTTEKIREKIKVPTKSRSALVQGEGRSMGMDID